MKPIYISRTKLPPLAKYVKYLKRIWKSNWLTNDGEMVRELENSLKDYWGVKNVVCVDHGTSALLLTLKAMDIKEISASPYSFIATCSAPAWLGIKQKFVDEGEKYGSPALVTHVYGIPNIVNAKKVIYDASHAFATKYKGKYLVSYGDASIISFHAVKIFQTVEGGAVVTNNDELAEKIRWMRNFGYKDRYSFQGIGINCKMSEFHAAMGLCSLENVDNAKKKYDRLIKRYNKALGYKHKNVTYYPIWYKTEKDLVKAITRFEDNNINVRRYFYPPLNKIFNGKTCPKTEDKMNRVLCLPLYCDLSLKEQNLVIKVAKETL
jgi:dTDP-4-amino-4,6-dideoxygalactose transaminase